MNFVSDEPLTTCIAARTLKSSAASSVGVSAFIASDANRGRSSSSLQLALLLPLSLPPLPTPSPPMPLRFEASTKAMLPLEATVGPAAKDA
eukprot:CAMPEP_0119321726 /NCGR_PEP_ID=MMETSP1333-20130426/56256_1 /TAXON_ID=418940 /ORGANISM="Scyphosphaera apsteinii, Strain RCC1455" /LENGTH=90 /DNA_ID=CAMNT_0007328763 /DNA_START=511 /DNA_END=780 /DNA_ORIENTATION=-